MKHSGRCARLCASRPTTSPLRQHLADTLLSYGRLEEAEQEYREALACAPQNQQLRIGLAKTLYQQGKNSPALAIIQDLIKNSLEIIPAQVYLLHARLLLRRGEIEQVAGGYEKALDADPSVADPILAEQLGLPVQPQRGYVHPENEYNHPENEGDEVIDGRVGVLVEGAPFLADADLERPTISFADVGGMEKLKDEIRLKIIHPLTHPEIYKAYGKAIGRGILMYGPPRLRQNAPGPCDSRRSQSIIFGGGHQRHSGYVAGQQRAQSARAV